MSLIDALKHPPVRKAGFELWLEDQEPELVQALVVAARNPAWTGNSLHRLLSEQYQVPVSKETLSKWMRKQNGSD